MRTREPTDTSFRTSSDSIGHTEEQIASRTHRTRRGSTHVRTRKSKGNWERVSAFQRLAPPQEAHEPPGPDPAHTLNPGRPTRPREPVVGEGAPRTATDAPEHALSIGTCFRRVGAREGHQPVNPPQPPDATFWSTFTYMPTSTTMKVTRQGTAPHENHNPLYLAHALGPEQEGGGREHGGAQGWVSVPAARVWVAASGF
jgi:hypothetical protein